MSDGLERIGDRCFYGSGITVFVVPKSVTEMGERVFQECAALKRVSFQAGSRLEKLEIPCVTGSALEEILIPRCVKEI